MLFPPIIGEIKQMPPALQDLYVLPAGLGPVRPGARGHRRPERRRPGGLGGCAGLRPFWFLETEESLLFSSEPGIVSSLDLVRDPHPLAPR